MKLKEIVDHNKRVRLLKTILGVGNLIASRCLSDISNVADFKIKGTYPLILAWLLVSF